MLRVFIIGDVEIVRYSIGSIENIGYLVDKKLIMWFVELRLWFKVFFIFVIGFVVCGFKVSFIIVL